MVENDEKPLSEDLEDEVSDLLTRLRAKGGLEKEELQALTLLFRIRVETGKIKPPAGKSDPAADMLARARQRANSN